jgi:hypothetical protein
MLTLVGWVGNHPWLQTYDILEFITKCAMFDLFLYDVILI